MSRGSISLPNYPQPYKSISRGMMKLWWSTSWVCTCWLVFDILSAPLTCKCELSDNSATGYVNMYKWSEFLKGFGPVTNVVTNVRNVRFPPLLRDANIASLESKVRNILTAPWFHGFLTSREAELLLEDQWPGTFLIRFSRSSGGSFALAFVQDAGNILHILSTSPPLRFNNWLVLTYLGWMFSTKLPTARI